MGKVAKEKREEKSQFPKNNSLQLLFLLFLHGHRLASGPARTPTHPFCIALGELKPFPVDYGLTIVRHI